MLFSLRSRHDLGVKLRGILLLVNVRRIVLGKRNVLG